MAGLTFRFADVRDIPLLADANAMLIEDERYEWRLSPADLAARWREWLDSDYTAVLFEDEGPAAYALFRPSEHGVYLRQFFVWPERRRRGVGRAAFELLKARVWTPGTRIELDVLCGNEGGLQFWKAIGFRDYAVRMELRRWVRPDGCT